MSLGQWRVGLCAAAFLSAARPQSAAAAAKSRAVVSRSDASLANASPTPTNGQSNAATGLRAAAPLARLDVEAALGAMSVQDKIGQLLMVGVAGTAINPSIARWVQQRRVGGIALFSRNIVDLKQTFALVQDIVRLSAGHVPPFVALDQEGGNVLRIKDGATVLPGNMTLGATDTAALAWGAGHALGVDLWRLGFNMNLAPVLDINSNPQNPVIGVRSFGERPELVGAMGAAFIRGQQEMGVCAVAKHFPGHGDTQTDSHFSMPAVDADLARLKAVEMAPFAQAIEAGLDAIMTAHIALPRVAEAPDVPATLSRTILTDILRQQMDFDGVIMTDGLEMQGIIERYGAGRAAVLAIVAGADMPMVLWSDEAREEVYQALRQAVQRGTISQARLDTSVRRILRLKARRGVFGQRPEPLAAVLAHHNENPLHKALAARIAQAGVTLVRNRRSVLPVDARVHRRLVVLAPPGAFADTLKKAPHTTVLTLPSVPSRTQRRALVLSAVRLAQSADLIVSAVINRYHVDIVKQVQSATSQLPVAVVSFASPYYIQLLPDIDAYVCTYSYLEQAQQAAADAVLGRSAMPGKLPVSVPGLYAFGHRVANGSVGPSP